MLYFFFFLFNINFLKCDEKEYLNNNIILYNKESNINLSDFDNYFIFLYNPWSNFSKNFYNNLKQANLKLKNKTFEFLIFVFDLTLIEKETIFYKIKIELNENNTFDNLIYVSNKSGIQYFKEIPKINYIQQFILYCLYEGAINIKEMDIKKIIKDEKEIIILFSSNKTIISISKKFFKKFHKIFYLLNSNEEKILFYSKGKIMQQFYIINKSISLLKEFLESICLDNKQIFEKINLRFIHNIFMQRKNFGVLFYNKYMNSTQNILNFIKRIISNNEQYKNIYFGITDINNQIQYKLMKFIGIEEKDFPSFSLVLFNNTNYDIRIMKEKITENNIINFIDEQFKFKKNNSFFQEKDFFINNIIEIKNIKSYEEFILGDNKSNKVIFIYNDWCSYCIQAKYLYKKVSNQKKGNKSFKFCQINIEKFTNIKYSLFSNFFINIKYIPSIFIIPTSLNNIFEDIIIYKGNYIYSELLAFVEKYEINNEL
jgi:hypothetical protein